MSPPEPFPQATPPADECPNGAAADSFAHGAPGVDRADDRRVSVCGGSALRAYTPTLWHAQQRQRDGQPKQERDSLRSRSKEGRPGSRKHRRWTRSQELVGALRKAMDAHGDERAAADVVAAEDRLLFEWRPSAFYRLLECEGPSGALEAWAAVESRRRPRSRPRANRPKSDSQVAEENERAVRHAFGGNWQYINGSDAAKDLLVELEKMAISAFGSAPPEEMPPAPGCGDSTTTPPWTVHWDGATMTTAAGAPPAAELAVLGLEPAQRKLVHQLARVLGLHSESRAAGESPSCAAALGGDGKAVALRRPKGQCAPGSTWVPPLSLSRVLAAF